MNQAADGLAAGKPVRFLGLAGWGVEAKEELVHGSSRIKGGG